MIVSVNVGILRQDHEDKFYVLKIKHFKSDISVLLKEEQDFINL